MFVDALSFSIKGDIITYHITAQRVWPYCWWLNRALFRRKIYVFASYLEVMFEGLL